MEALWERNVYKGSVEVLKKFREESRRRQDEREIDVEDEEFDWWKLKKVLRL